MAKEDSMTKIVHFEIPVDDNQRASDFYRSSFGWEISGFGDQPYWLVRAGADDEPGANGALIARGEVHQTPVLVIGVENLDAALERVSAGGGQVVQPRIEIPGVGWSAYVRDTEGNTVGVFQPVPRTGG
jgi:predicted enzyme related to lactoylglutathione lyase